MKQLTNIYLPLLLAILMLCIAHGVSCGTNNNSFLELGVKKTSIGYQADVISSLIENSIPFYIDVDGILKYPGRYKEQVNTILNKLNRRPEVQFSDYKFASLFIVLLTKNDINFLIREGSNKTDIHIVYQEKDKKFVDDIIYPEFKKLLLEGHKTGVYGSQGKFNN